MSILNLFCAVATLLCSASAWIAPHRSQLTVAAAHCLTHSASQQCHISRAGSHLWGSDAKSEVNIVADINSISEISDSEKKELISTTTACFDEAKEILLIDTIQSGKQPARKENAEEQSTEKVLTLFDELSDLYSTSSYIGENGTTAQKDALTDPFILGNYIVDFELSRSLVTEQAMAQEMPEVAQSGNVTVKRYKYPPGGSGTAAGGAFRGKIGEMIYKTTGVYQNILPVTDPNAPKFASAGTAAGGSSYVMSGDGAALIEDTPVAKRERRRREYAVPVAEQVDAVVVNMIRGRLFGVLPLTVLLRGWASRITEDERLARQELYNVSLSKATVQATFEAPLIGFGGPDLDHSAAAGRGSVPSWRGMTLRVGPPSRVVLDTPYVGPRLRLGLGSRGTKFVFTRTPGTGTNPVLPTSSSSIRSSSSNGIGSSESKEAGWEDAESWRSAVAHPAVRGKPAGAVLLVLALCCALAASPGSAPARALYSVLHSQSMRSVALPPFSGGVSSVLMGVSEAMSGVWVAACGVLARGLASVGLGLGSAGEPRTAAAVAERVIQRVGPTLTMVGRVFVQAGLWGTALLSGSLGLLLAFSKGGIVE